MQWTDEATARLLVHILKIHNVKLDYEQLAQCMGPECTAKAVMHRVARIKATAAADGDDADDADFDGKANPAGGRKTATPTKRKRAKKGAETADNTAADGNAEGPSAIGTQTEPKPKQKRARRGKAAKKEESTNAVDEHSGLAGGEGTSQDAASDQNAQVEATSGNED